MFYSRFSLDELKQADLRRGVEAARILDLYPGREKYADFLKIYTPMLDPFVHEARVHLFRRDYHMHEIQQYGDDEEKQRLHCTIVYQENRIMSTYFHHTLNNSNYLFSDAEINLVTSCFDVSLLSDSWVSRHLITRFTDNQIRGLIGLLLLAALAVDRYYGRRKKKTCS
jgi:hypothetical protein